jgi:hypothetical protein
MVGWQVKEMPGVISWTQTSCVYSDHSEFPTCVSRASESSRLRDEKESWRTAEPSRGRPSRRCRLAGDVDDFLGRRFSLSGIAEASGERREWLKRYRELVTLNQNDRCTARRNRLAMPKERSGAWARKPWAMDTVFMRDNRPNSAGMPLLRSHCPVSVSITLALVARRVVPVCNYRRWQSVSQVRV